MQECGKLANKPSALENPPVCAQTVLLNEVCTDNDTINYNHGLGHCVLFQSTRNNAALFVQLYDLQGRRCLVRMVTRLDVLKGVFLHTLPPIPTYYFKSG